MQTDLGTETSSTSHTMQVSVWVLRHVVIEDNVYTLNIHTTTEQIGGYQDPLHNTIKGLVSIFNI